MYISDNQHVVALSHPATDGHAKEMRPTSIRLYLIRLVHYQKYHLVCFVAVAILEESHKAVSRRNIDLNESGGFLFIPAKSEKCNNAWVFIFLF